MAHSVKRLPQKGVVMCACDPRTRETETEGPLGLAGQLNC